jgi:serine/threonine protein kinase/WD40 repeat protein
MMPRALERVEAWVNEESPGHHADLAAGFAPGSRLGGYRLEEQVGAGGMAVVFRAHDERLDRLVALKIMTPAMGSDDMFRQRFIRESRAAAAVEDPHIIPVYEAGEAGHVLFIAMRLVRGGDVRSLLRREGPLSPERVASIISPVASALDAAHAAGLVHRDVKPANILLDRRPGRPDHVYLSDFGLSKSAEVSLGLTAAGQFLGTPDYTAPEQIEGLPVDGRTDQYALACAVFELLTGQAPFHRSESFAAIWAHLNKPPPPLAERRPGLPQAADLVMAKALAKAQVDRYETCWEFADALRDALGLPPYHLSSASEPGLARPGSIPGQGSAGLVSGPDPPRGAALSPAPVESPSPAVSSSPDQALSPGQARSAGQAPSPEAAAGSAVPPPGQDTEASEIYAARSPAMNRYPSQPGRESQVSIPDDEPTDPGLKVIPADLASVQAPASDQQEEPGDQQEEPSDQQEEPSAPRQQASPPAGQASPPAPELVGTPAQQANPPAGQASPPAPELIATPAQQASPPAGEPAGARAGQAAAALEQPRAAPRRPTPPRSWPNLPRTQRQRPGTTPTWQGPTHTRQGHPSTRPGAPPKQAAAPGRAAARGRAAGPGRAAGEVQGGLQPRRRRAAYLALIGAGILAAAGLAVVLTIALSTHFLVSPGNHRLAPSAYSRYFSPPEQAGILSSVAFSPDGRTLAAGTMGGPKGDGVTYLWNVRSTKEIRSFSPGGGAEAFSPNGTMLAAAGGPGNSTTYLWQVDPKRLIATLPGQQGVSIKAVAFSANGKKLAVNDETGVVRVWTLPRGRGVGPAAVVSPPLPGVNSYTVAFSPVGSTLAMGGSDGQVYLWNEATGNFGRTLIVPGGDAVTSVAFSPDGRALAAGEMNGVTYVWYLARRTPITLLDPGGSPIESVAFSPDSSWLATGDDDGKTYLWHLPASKPARTLTNPKGPATGPVSGKLRTAVFSVAFSPSGTTLATTDTNGHAYLWKVSG